MLKTGDQFWWQYKGRGKVPVVFLKRRRNRGEEISIVRSEHDGRTHDVRDSALFRATDPAAWSARVVELRTESLGRSERERILDSYVSVRSLLDELKRSRTGAGKKRTLEAVLAAAARIGSREVLQ